MSILWDMEFFSSVAAIWKFNFVMSLAFCCEFSRWIDAQQHRWNPNVQGCGQLTAVKRKTTLQEAKGVNWVNILEQLDSSRPAQGLCRFCFFLYGGNTQPSQGNPPTPTPPPIQKKKKNLNRSLFSIRSYETEPVRFSISMSLGRKKRESFPCTKSHSGTNVTHTLVPILHMTGKHQALCVSLFPALNWRWRTCSCLWRCFTSSPWRCSLLPRWRR